MIKSLIKRFVQAFFLLGVISVIGFGLSKLVPGDEILDYLSIDDPRYTSAANALEQRTAYRQVAAKRGLDKPLFYFSVSPGYYPDSLFSIVPISDRSSVTHWIKQSKQSEAAMKMYRDFMEGLAYSCPKSDTSTIAVAFCEGIGDMIDQQDIFSVHHSFLRLQQKINADSLVGRQYTEWMSVYKDDIEVLIKPSKGLSAAAWLPSFGWHGTNNQYHQWITGMVSLQPLTSLIDGRDAWAKIFEALKWTLLLNGWAFILAIVLGMAIGLWAGTHDGSQLERLINIFLFALFALPSFWMATLFIYFLSSGEWLSVFPTGGLGSYHSAGNIFERWGIISSHLILPVLCLALGSLAYVSRQMKQSVMQQLIQPYVFSLRTQGVSEKTILRKHVFKNALFPMITLIGGSLPALLSGSLIIEVIFSIPGMGRLLYSSLMARDWPVVFPILMMVATITVFAYILTDLVYKWADPRVKTLGS